MRDKRAALSRGGICLVGLVTLGGVGWGWEVGFGLPSITEFAVTPLTAVVAASFLTGTLLLPRRHSVRA